MIDVLKSRRILVIVHNLVELLVRLQIVNHPLSGLATFPDAGLEPERHWKDDDEAQQQHQEGGHRSISIRRANGQVEEIERDHDGQQTHVRGPDVSCVFAAKMNVAFIMTTYRRRSDFVVASKVSTLETMLFLIDPRGSAIKNAKNIALM